MNEALILELLGEVRGLRAELARAHAGAAVPVACHALLAEIAAHVGERAFTSSELLQHADTANAWLDALANAGAATPRCAGKLFQKIAGRNLSGFVVERTGRESGGTVWAVRSHYRARMAGLSPRDARGLVRQHYPTGPIPPRPPAPARAPTPEVDPLPDVNMELETVPELAAILLWRLLKFLVEALR